MKLYPSYEWFITPHWMRRFGPLKLVTGSLVDRVGLHFFTLYSALTGVMAGAFTLNAVILRKTLNADPLAIGVITALSMAALLVGIFGAEVVQGREKRVFIFWLGLLSRGSFLLFFFCRDALSFIVVAGLFYFLNALLMPAVFAMWQANVSSAARNRLWGLTVTVTTIITMIVAYLAGKMLDYDPWSYRWMLPAAGAVAIFAIMILAQSPLRGRYKLNEQAVTFSWHNLVRKPVRSFVKLLRTDRHFLHFEMAFFFYGLAIMLLFPTIPLYMVDVAQMTYEETGIASGIMAQIGVVLFSPLWGRLMDRMGPCMLCAIVFGLLALLPAILLIGPLIGGGVIPLRFIVYAGFLIFGIGMSGVSVAWGLGPVYFAGNKDASSHSGAHVTITGIRGSFAPILGALGTKYIGFAPVFATSMVLFLIGVAGMILVHWRASRGAYGDQALH